MAILKNVEGWWFRLDPNKPDKYDPDRPTWNFQARTSNKEQAKEWKENHFSVKAVRENPDDEESKILYWKTIMGKKVINQDGKPAQPVQIVSSKGDIDPNTIGNGSIVNVRLYQYEYEFQSKKGIANSLQAIQLVKHVVYTRKPGEDFEDEVETEVVIPEDSDESPQNSSKPSAPRVPGGGTPKVPDNSDSEY